MAKTILNNNPPRPICTKELPPFFHVAHPQIIMIGASNIPTAGTNARDARKQENIPTFLLGVVM